MSELAFILRQKPFKNTSQILEVFTLGRGKISVIAHGVNRPKSSLAGTLRAFNLLEINLAGKSDLKTLTSADLTETYFSLSGLALYCGFYINEMLLYLLHKEDPHPLTFKAYQVLLKKLSQENFSPLCLRQFEYQLLSEMGFGFDLTQDKNGHKIKPNKNYIFHHGLVLTDKINTVSGEHLQALNNPQSDLIPSPELNRLMRARIDAALDGRKLKSRDLLKDYLRVQK